MDTQGLLREAKYPGAVAWSDDNLLAVASGSSAVVFSPANLAGPRAHLPQEEEQEQEMGKKEKGKKIKVEPKNAQRQIMEAPADHAMGQLLRMRDEASVCAQTRGLAWAPSGTAPAGGCLLTVLSDDGKVCGLLAAAAASCNAPSAHACASHIVLERRSDSGRRATYRCCSGCMTTSGLAIGRLPCMLEPANANIAGPSTLWRGD